MYKQIFCTALAVFFVLCAKAQSDGEIHGKVVDSKGKSIPGAMVSATNGIDLNGQATDDNGKFRIKPLRPGTYTVTVTSLGMDTMKFTGVVVNPDLISFVPEVKMRESSTNGHLIGEIRVEEMKVPLIRQDGDHIQTILAEDLKNRATTHGGNISKIVATMSSDFKPAVEGGGMSVRGSREGGVLYFIDGVKVRDTEVSVPACGISSVSVYSGGIPAKYGDTTGGVVIVNTKSYTEDYYKKLNN
jgi:hypothetical protein